MYYKEYGNTGMKVSAIGFGAMRYDDADIKAGNLSKCAEVPLYALEKGINYWDTAPFYCDDKSEEITGLAVKQIKRSDIILCSKANLGTMGEGEPTRDKFFKRLDTTLTRLNTDYLDIYQMWCLLSLDKYEKTMEIMYRWFEEAKEQGLVKHICFSSHMEGNGIERVVDSGKFEGMLIGYNALNYRFRQSGIHEAAKRGMGVACMNPLGGGLIPQNPDAFSYLTKWDEEFLTSVSGAPVPVSAAELNLNTAQAALRFVASHKEITVALNGATTKAHIDDAVKAVEGLVEVSANDIPRLYGDGGKALNDLCTGCGYCKGCPVEIDIPKYMDAYNMSILTGDKQEALKRLAWHWSLTKEGAGECIQCGNCENECTQHLPIIERLKEISELEKSGW